MTLNVKDFDQKKDYPDYKPSEADEKKLGYVATRFTAMKANRTNVDKEWWTYQTMIDAILEPYPDERSSSTVPLSSSLIELYVADAVKIPTEYIIKAETSQYDANAKALDYVWKYDRRKNKRKKAFVAWEYIVAGFGTQIMYTGFDSYNRTQKDPIVWDNMKLEWETITYKEEKIIVKNVDIRKFYIDNTAIESIEEAADCIYDQWIGFEKFQWFKDSPVYKNLDKVKPTEYSNEYETFVTEEWVTKQWEFVKLRHYWNVEKDAYIVIANDAVIIREHPMTSTIDGKKALPFVIRVLGKKNYSIYGRGLCEALLMFNSEVNNLREQLMDAIRRSNSQVLALGNWLTFNWRDFRYDNEILTFDGNLGNNFHQLSGNAPNQAIFSYLDRLYKDIAMYVGIDIQNILGEPQQTAFQTEVQREASQKRVNVWLTNRDLAYERFADLYKDLLQKYFPRADAEWLYPNIEIEDEEYVEGSDNKPAKFKKKKGKYMFEVTPESLRGDMYVDAYTNTTAPTINAVDRAQKMEFMNTASQIIQGYAIAKQSGFDLEKVLPMRSTISDLANDFNMQPQDNESHEEVKEEKNKLMEEMQWMMSKPTPMPMEEALPPTEQPWVTETTAQLPPM